MNVMCTVFLVTCLMAESSYVAHVWTYILFTCPSNMWNTYAVWEAYLFLAHIWQKRVKQLCRWLCFDTCMQQCCIYKSIQMEGSVTYISNVASIFAQVSSFWSRYPVIGLAVRCLDIGC